MSCTFGLRSWRCRECDATLQLPWDHGLPLDCQPVVLRRAWARTVTAHAQQTPLLHPLLLPTPYAPTGSCR